MNITVNNIQLFSILSAQRARQSVFLATCLAFLVGCSSLPVADVQADVVENQQPIIESTEVEELVRVEPPKQELDAELLEQLMIANFASFAGDDEEALSSSMTAAELSQDFRLARMASVLALRSNSYDEVAQASALWYQLDEESEDAYNTLLLGLVGSGDVAGALSRFDQRLEEIEQENQQQNLASQTLPDTSLQNAALAASGQQDDVAQQNSSELERNYQPNEPIDIHIRQVSGLLVRQSNGESAVQISEEYVRRYADSAQVLLSASYVANYFEQTDTAEGWLSQALELRPNWDVAAQMYAGMLARQGKDEERVAYIGSYIKDNPESVAMRIQYAVELARQEEYQAGLDVMQQVVQDDETNVGAIVYAAALAQQLEQDELTEDLYLKAVALEPDNDNVLWSLAAFAIADENYRKAESYYERVGRGEYFFRAQLQIANMRYEIRGLTSAVNFLRRIRPRTEGEFIEIALSRHYMLMQDHQYEEALGYINDSLVYLPESDDLVYARALVAAELKELAIAESDFRAIIERNPEHANALNALGYTLADQTDRYEEAKELILKALELRPQQGHILDSMGWVLYRLEDYQGAISYLQQAYDVMKEAEVATHLGEVYWESGQQQQAREIWQEAYELDPNNLVLLETLKRYGQLEQYAKQDAK